MDSTTILPTIWVLADDRIGNVNQCLGVAESLGFPTIHKNIVYNRLASLPNYLRAATTVGVNHSKSDAVTAPYPDIVIAAGRKTAPIARYIKKQSGGKTLTVQLMWPGNPTQGLDIIAAPKHDTLPSLPADTHTVLITTVGAPHRVTTMRLQEEYIVWQERLKKYPKPHIAVMIGGTTKNHHITDSHITQLGTQLAELIEKQGGSLLVSTSRRTDAPIISALKTSLGATPCYFHQWTPEGENPYFGFLAAGDNIVVTGDSMSMCSEACATGKPVYIFSPEDITSRKHNRLHKQLYALGFAQSFNDIDKEVIKPYTPLNVAEEIATVIKRSLQEKAANTQLGV